VSTIEELLERKSSGSGLENRDYGRKRSAALTTRHPSICKKLALTSSISEGLSVGIVRSRTMATELFIITVCFIPNTDGCGYPEKESWKFVFIHVVHNQF
jgi:hypothetical protein